MIRTIDIRLNAAHPELPLPEATTYQGAPSTAFLRGVPKGCGQWQITAVNVAVTFPDGSTTTRAAVLSAGDVWVATIPACATSGRTVSGLRILADGTDENGDAVTGYVLGVADLAVATFDIAPAPGVTSYALRYFDNVPNPPHKGDVAKIANVLKYYDGTAWQVFADVDLSDYATKADATLTPIFDSPEGATWSVAYPQGWTYGTVSVDPWDGSLWKMDLDSSGDTFGASNDINAASFSGTYEGLTVVATRTDAPAGNRLGPDAESNPNRNKPLASEAEAEALRTAVAGKYAKPSGGIPKSDLASAVQTSLGKADTALQAHQQLGIGGDALHWEITSVATDLSIDWDASSEKWVLKQDGVIACYDGEGNAESLSLYWAAADNTLGVDVTATRQMAGWTLGTQADKPLATAAQGAKAETAVQPAALNAAIPYSLGAPTVISTASSEVVEDETVYYGGATLADRTANIVQVTAALDELRITFPAAVSGKVRDFGLRVEIGTGSAALTAPALVPIAPTGETIRIENNAAEIPALADGTATATGVTLLYFSENAPGVFVVKGEQVQEVA